MASARRLVQDAILSPVAGFMQGLGRGGVRPSAEPPRLGALLRLAADGTRCDVATAGGEPLPEGPSFD